MSNYSLKISIQFEEYWEVIKVRVGQWDEFDVYNTPVNLIQMVLPLNNNTERYHEYTYYQAVIVSELVTTLSLFIILQMLHYCLWGHDEQIAEWKKREEGEPAPPLPPSEWVLLSRS